jgi:hypothetical protein
MPGMQNKQWHQIIIMWVVTLQYPSVTTTVVLQKFTTLVLYLLSVRSHQSIFIHAVVRFNTFNSSFIIPLQLYGAKKLFRTRICVLQVVLYLLSVRSHQSIFIHDVVRFNTFNSSFIIPLQLYGVKKLFRTRICVLQIVQYLLSVRSIFNHNIVRFNTFNSSSYTPIQLYRVNNYFVQEKVHLSNNMTYKLKSIQKKQGLK